MLCMADYDHDIDDFSITLLPRGLHKPKSGTAALAHGKNRQSKVH